MPQISGVAAYHNHPPQIPHAGFLGSLSRQDIERMIQTPEGAAVVKMWMQGFLPASERSPGPSRTPSPDIIKEEPQEEEQYDDEPMELTTKRALSPESYESPLRCIQNMSVGSVSSGEQSPRSTGEDLEEDPRTPKVNSHGKVKLNKCRNCMFITPTKEEYWKHIIEHMNPDKILRCPSCPFVTEYKHHLEYHLNNHTGAKPYKCGECSYSCVNKSMLNSHLKSHSPVYQYRCQDCHYVTKYCHSFKQHLRKYKHNPLVVLNPDGTENPDTIIDVYGTRRGPKQKPMKQVNGASPTSSRENLLPRPNLPLAYNPFMMNPFMLPHLLGMFPGPFPGAIAMNLNMKDAQQQFEHKQPNFNLPPKHNDSLSPTRSESDNESLDDDSTVKNENLQNNNNVLNCRHCGISFVHRDMYVIHMSFHDSQNPFKCEKCSTVCKDSVDFFRHLTTVPH